MAADLENLLRVKKKHLPKAIQTFALAFANDPLTNYLFSSEKEKQELLPFYCEFRIKYGIRYGEVYATSENIEGFAVWVKPKNIDMTMWRMFRVGGIKLFRILRGELKEKIMELLQHTSKLQHETTTESHWHLTPIGVDPEHQGKGYASKLMKAMMKKFDEEKASCLLETQSEKNVEIYKRYGFKVVYKGTIPKAELDHLIMIRKPEKIKLI